MLKSKDFSRAEGYASLAKALGNTATYELVSHTVKTSSVNDLEMLGNLLKLECEKLTKLGIKFARLNPGMLCDINASISVPDACEEAANWIAETSGSGKTSVVNLKKILMDFITTNNNLRTFDEILLLHSRVAPDATSQPRGILYNGSPLPSSYAGRALFQNQLNYNKLPLNSPLYPQYLLGWIVGWHPFSDGNGRTARAAYAITAIKNKCWKPLTKTEEDRLTGL